MNLSLNTQIGNYNKLTYLIENISSFFTNNLNNNRIQGIINTNSSCPDREMNTDVETNEKSESAALFEDKNKIPDNSFRNFGKTKPIFFLNSQEPLLVIGPHCN